tara:strand:- start:1518 stop:3275 length:1758 start_codon:yes stop_codon:yes gene_type:complete
MSSYWSVDETMRIGQTFVSIPSENGLEYGENQKIQLYVDPSTKYLDGHNSYLEFNVKLKLPAGQKPTRLQLDEMGASCLLKNIRIYDGSRGQLLEELESYSSLCSVRYDYDADRSQRNYRALREGALAHGVANRGTKGTSQTAMANTVTNPYFKKTSGNQTTVFSSDDDFLTAKVCIPLHTGIFAQNEHIFPVMMTNGLYIEIDTAPAREVIKQLDSVCRLRRTALNPFFHSLENGSTTWPAANADVVTKFFVGQENNIAGPDAVAHFPFVVGETVNFVQATNSTVASVLTGDSTITAINLSANGLVEVTITGAANNGATSVAIVGTSGTAATFVLYSTSVEGAVGSSYDAKYTISNVNLVVSQVTLDPAYERGMLQKVKEGKAIEIDILTSTNYKTSILASDRQTTYQVYAQNSRAKSLLVIPQDSQVYTTRESICGIGTYPILKNTDPEDTILNSNRSGYTGICDELTDIQYQIGGRLVPSRPINVSKIASRKSIDNFHLYELEKCLDNSGIVPRSFRAFQSNFVFGRGFGVNGGAMSLQGKDMSVILRYTSTDAPVKPKLFNNFVTHVRRFMIRDGSIEIIP